MPSNFSIASMVSQLNVAARMHLENVKVVNTDLSMRILFLLYKNGVIRGFFVKSTYILVFLKYSLGKSLFRDISIVSRPGCRVFWNLRLLSLIYNFNSFSGFYIISSPKGLITSSDSLIGLHLSGEVLLKVSI